MRWLDDCTVGGRRLKPRTLEIYERLLGAILGTAASDGIIDRTQCTSRGAGWLTRAALAKLHQAAPETTATLAMPFVVYLLADHLRGSGVLAVLVRGLYLRIYSHTAITSGGWLLGRSVWNYADYIITSLFFVFIGFELTAVLESDPVGAGSVILEVVVVLTLVVVRFGWIFPAVWLERAPHRRSSRDATPVGNRESIVTAWAGMRGMVTVATALALPTLITDGGTFPERHTIVFVGLVAVLATLVLQGVTLPPLVCWLKVGSDVDVAGDVQRLRRRATAAALEAMRDDTSDVPERARNAVDDLLRKAAEVERELVIDARHRGKVGPEVADEVLSDIESRAVRDSKERPMPRPRARFLTSVARSAQHSTPHLSTAQVGFRVGRVPSSRGAENLSSEAANTGL